MRFRCAEDSYCKSLFEDASNMHVCGKICFFRNSVDILKHRISAHCCINLKAFFPSQNYDFKIGEKYFYFNRSRVQIATTHTFIKRLVKFTLHLYRSGYRRYFQSSFFREFKLKIKGKVVRTVINGQFVNNAERSSDQYYHFRSRIKIYHPNYVRTNVYSITNG